MTSIRSTPNLVFLSSNVLQQPSGDQIFQEWLGEVENVGSTVLCEVSIDVALKDSSGTQLASFTAFASADPYLAEGLSVTLACLAPGQIGSFYDNGFVATPAPLAAVTAISATLTGLSTPGAAPAPDAPIVASHVTPIFGGFGLVGTITGRTGAIYDIGFEGYPRDASGLVLGQIIATDLDTLAPSAVFSFMTTDVASPFTDYRQFVDFIDGPRPTNAAADPATSATAAIERARRTRRQAIQARAAQVRLTAATAAKDF